MQSTRDPNSRQMVRTHIHKHTSVLKQETVTALFNQAVHTDREVTANRPDIIIKNRKHAH